MKLLTIFTVLLASVMPASARFYDNWKCGELSVQVQTYKDWRETGAQREKPILTQTLVFEGLKPDARVSFKWIAETPYVNGKRCRIIPDDPNPDSKTTLTNSLIGGATQTLLRFRSL